MDLKNGFGKCSLVMLISQWNANMEKVLFDWPILLQYDVKAKYRFDF